MNLDGIYNSILKESPEKIGEALIHYLTIENLPLETKVDRVVEIVRSHTGACQKYVDNLYLCGRLLERARHDADTFMFMTAAVLQGAWSHGYLRGLEFGQKMPKFVVAEESDAEPSTG
jgi:hypothetical protein